MSGVGAPKPLLIVAGMAREARGLDDRHSVVLSGADAALLRSRLFELAPSDYAGVVSFGLAGGLDPALKPGDLALGTRALAPGAAYDAHPKFIEWLAQRARKSGLAFATGPVAGVELPVMTVADKSALRGRTRAIAVDMESHAAGDFAARARLPFAIVRVVSDPAERALPQLVAHAIGADGRVRLGYLLAALARAPGQLGALLQTGRDSRAAFRTLRKCGDLFG